MAGMKGFVHKCGCEKVAKTGFAKSIKESPFSYAQIDMIWDFYVTHAIGGESALKREIAEYGWDKTNNKTTGTRAIENLLFDKKYIDQICFIRSKTCKDTLKAMDLSGELICASHSRAVLLQNYCIDIDENENIKYSSNNTSESKLNALFRHIRNSLAHGGTYFFENDMLLLEDKDGTKTTAAILLKQQTLFDWIKIIDKDERFYILHDACSSYSSK